MRMLLLYFSRSAGAESQMSWKVTAAQVRLVYSSSGGPWQSLFPYMTAGARLGDGPKTLPTGPVCLQDNPPKRCHNQALVDYLLELCQVFTTCSTRTQMFRNVYVDCTWDVCFLVLLDEARQTKMSEIMSSRSAFLCKQCYCKSAIICYYIRWRLYFFFSFTALYYYLQPYDTDM